MAYEILSLGEPQEPRPVAQAQPDSFSLTELARKGGGLVARGVESLVGLPGDIASAVQGLSNAVTRGLSQVTGLPEDPLGSLVAPLGSKSPALHLAKKAVGLVSPEAAERIPETVRIPTSEDLRSVTKFVTGDTLEPRSDIESHLQDFTSTVVPMLIGGVSTGRSVASAGLGQLAKFGAQKLNVPEKYQDPIKMGTMFATSLVGMPTMRSFAKKLYTQAEASLPKDAVMKAEQLMPKIHELKKATKHIHFKDKNTFNAIINTIEREFASSEASKYFGKKTEQLMPKIHELKKAPKNTIKKEFASFKMRSKTVPLAQIWEQKKNINDWLRDPSIRRSSEASKYFGKLSGIVKDALVEEAKTSAPEFVKHLTRADEIWAALSKQPQATTVIGSALQRIKRHMNPLTVGLFSYLYPRKALTVLGLKSAKDMADVVRMSLSNRGVRHYLGSVIQESLKNNHPGVIRAMKKVDKELQKEITSGSQGKSYEILSLGD